MWSALWLFLLLLSPSFLLITMLSNHSHKVSMASFFFILFLQRHFPYLHKHWHLWDAARTHKNEEEERGRKKYAAVTKRSKTEKKSGWKECRCAYIYPFIPTASLHFSCFPPSESRTLGTLSIYNKLLSLSYNPSIKHTHTYEDNKHKWAHTQTHSGILGPCSAVISLGTFKW